MGRQRNPNGFGTYRRKKDGRIEWRQKIDGEERYVSAYTMKELQEKIKKVAGLPIAKAGKYKVCDWFEQWLETYVKPLKKSATYEQYNFIYIKHIKPVIGHRRINNIKKVDIQTVIAKMNEKGLSTWTMKHARKIMNIAFTKALDEQIISKNPVERIEIPTKQAKPRKTLTLEELSKLFKAMEHSRWIWSVKFMLVTGLRRGELLALKWSDVDFDNKRITIDESNSRTGIGDTKNSKIHYVHLSDKAILYLNEQAKQLEKETNPILYNKKLKKSNLIFPSINGTMLNPNSYYTMLARFAKKAGIKASPHCLRHTFVYMTRETLSLKEIQAILGHDESTTTLDIYGDIINDNTEKTAKRIDDVFDKLTEEIQKVENRKIEKTGNVITVDFRRAK